MPTRKSANASSLAEYGPAIQPPVGKWIAPDTVCSMTSIAITSGASGLLHMMPFEVGPVPMAFDQMGITINTAGAGLTDGAQRIVLGIYPSNEEGSLPNMANGPVSQGSIIQSSSVTNQNFASAGTKIATLSSAPLNPPGRYFMAALWYQTAAPSTYPSVNCVNISLMSWSDSVPTGQPQFRSVLMSGQTTTLPTSANPSLSGSSLSTIICPWLRRSA